jgi:hypothetical protein
MVFVLATQQNSASPQPTIKIRPVAVLDAWRLGQRALSRTTDTRFTALTVHAWCQSRDPNCPYLRTPRRAVRRCGHLRLIIGRTCPYLRTPRRAVRRRGHLDSDTVPYTSALAHAFADCAQLRTAGPCQDSQSMGDVLLVPVVLLPYRQSSCGRLNALKQLHHEADEQTYRQAEDRTDA